MNGKDEYSIERGASSSCAPKRDRRDSGVFASARFATFLSRRRIIRRTAERCSISRIDVLWGNTERKPSLRNGGIILYHATMMGELTHDQCEELLHSRPYGHLGLHAEGETYVVPVMYTYHKGAVYGHSYEGKKAAMMRKNPRVCLQAEDIRTPNEWRSVIISGTAKELTGNDAQKAVRIIVDRLKRFEGTWEAYLPFSEESASHPARSDGSRPIFYKIVIETIVGRYEKHPPMSREEFIETLLKVDPML